MREYLAHQFEEDVLKAEAFAIMRPYAQRCLRPRLTGQQSQAWPELAGPEARRGKPAPRQPPPRGWARGGRNRCRTARLPGP
jgi:hypothetical protein